MHVIISTAEMFREYAYICEKGKASLFLQEKYVIC